LIPLLSSLFADNTPWINVIAYHFFTNNQGECTYYHAYKQLRFYFTVLLFMFLEIMCALPIIMFVL